jgi:hypothetical protein
MSDMIAFLSTAGGKEAYKVNHEVAVDRAVDVPLLPSTLYQAGAPEEVEVVRERRPGHAQGVLNFAHRYLAPDLDEEEEHLQTCQVRERLKGRGMFFRCLEARECPCAPFHSLKSME